MRTLCIYCFKGHDDRIACSEYFWDSEAEKVLPEYKTIDQILRHALMAIGLRDYTSAERKAAPLHTVMAEYFPDALMSIARLSKKANDKHNPGEPVHWSRGKSDDHLECAARHMLTPDRVDEETGEIELVAAAWRLLAEVQIREERRLVKAGIRPLSGVIPD